MCGEGEIEVTHGVVKAGAAAVGEVRDLVGEDECG